MDNFEIGFQKLLSKADIDQERAGVELIVGPEEVFDEESLRRLQIRFRDQVFDTICFLTGSERSVSFKDPWCMLNENHALKRLSEGFQPRTKKLKLSEDLVFDVEVIPAWESTGNHLVVNASEKAFESWLVQETEDSEILTLGRPLSPKVFIDWAFANIEE